MSLSPADALSLTDNDGLEHLLSELWLTLLDGGQEHVSDGSGWQTVESGLNSVHSEHVQVLGTSVVSAVHDRSHWQRVGDLQLDSVASSSTYTAMWSVRFPMKCLALASDEFSPTSFRHL